MLGRKSLLHIDKVERWVAATLSLFGISLPSNASKCSYKCEKTDLNEQIIFEIAKEEKIFSIFPKIADLEKEANDFVDEVKRSQQSSRISRKSFALKSTELSNLHIISKEHTYFQHSVSQKGTPPTLSPLTKSRTITPDFLALHSRKSISQHFSAISDSCINLALVIHDYPHLSKLMSAHLISLETARLPTRSHLLSVLHSLNSAILEENMLIEELISIILGDFDNSKHSLEFYIACSILIVNAFNIYSTLSEIGSAKLTHSALEAMSSSISSVSMNSMSSVDMIDSIQSTGGFHGQDASILLISSPKRKKISHGSQVRNKTDIFGSFMSDTALSERKKDDLVHSFFRSSSMIIEREGIPTSPSSKHSLSRVSGLKSSTLKPTTSPTLPRQGIKTPDSLRLSLKDISTGTDKKKPKTRKKAKFDEQTTSYVAEQLLHASASEIHELLKRNRENLK
ncbi:hypothetical protein ADUPG1_012790 [Aduncisulcus paluster]|uniref:Uncharacterized protein n=1 Tax=Aduncisulcus paluster TaxID=2918883 RepID=A0ABQ5K0P9_9EUKA|nr:hypothetical protein ADUPG1_012790 [Aduncisulcus paluster]